MENLREHIDGLLSGCERQAEAWEKIRPAEFDLTDPCLDEKYKILCVTLGYIGRMLELYHDTKLALEDERLLLGVLSARPLVECAAMMCLFNEQMKRHFWPSPSPECMHIIDKHLSGGRHKVSEEKSDVIRSFHINDAIRESNEFARQTNKNLKSHFNVSSNVEVLVPGAIAIDYKVVEELGPFGWIYSWLSELAHPNPIGNLRYFGEHFRRNEVVGVEPMKFYIAEGFGKMFYASIAAKAIFSACGVKSSN